MLVALLAPIIGETISETNGSNRDSFEDKIKRIVINPRIPNPYYYGFLSEADWLDKLTYYLGNPKRSGGGYSVVVVQLEDPYKHLQQPDLFGGDDEGYDRFFGFLGRLFSTVVDEQIGQHQDVYQLLEDRFAVILDSKVEQNINRLLHSIIERVETLAFEPGLPGNRALTGFGVRIAVLQDETTTSEATTGHHNPDPTYIRGLVVRALADAHEQLIARGYSSIAVSVHRKRLSALKVLVGAPRPSTVQEVHNYAEDAEAGSSTDMT